MIRHPASFRDPSGYISSADGELYRIILPAYFSEYDRLRQSGLYARLVERGWLVPHREVRRDQTQIVMQPTALAFISYPCEWCFEALKRAALLHLQICLLAIEHDMILKDASAYNVQFIGNKPIFIDTLSFTHYRDGTPWYAFGQFCRQFIAPLLLMKYRSLALGKISHSFIDGIPLDVASKILPWQTCLSPFILLNIHLHSRNITRANQGSRDIHLAKQSLLNLFNYTAAYLKRLTYGKQKSHWSNYRQMMNYAPAALREKIEVVRCWSREIKARRIWDVGGNDGYIAQQVASDTELIINTDCDPIAIDRSFRDHPRLLSLHIDLANPTPAYGYANREREAFIDRIRQAKIDCIFALAVLHHLTLTAACSFSMLAELFAQLGSYLVVEYVDRQDSWAATMLAQMRDNSRFFVSYRRDNFEQEFQKSFTILKTHEVSGSFRTLYLMQRKSQQRRQHQ